MSEKQLCPSCQTVLRPNARFCEECGTPVAASPVTEQAAAPKKRDWRPWVAIGATLLLCAAVYLPPMLFPDYRDARANAQGETSSEVTFYAVGNVMRRQNNGTGPIRTMLRRGDAVTGTILSDGGKTWLVASDNGDYISTAWLMDTAPPDLVQRYEAYPWDVTAKIDVRAGDSSFSPVIKQLEPGTAIMLRGLTSSGFVEFELDDKTIGYIDIDDLGFDPDSAESRSVEAQARDLVATLRIAPEKPLMLTGLIGDQKVTLNIAAPDDDSLTGEVTYINVKSSANCGFKLRFAGRDAQGRILFDQRQAEAGGSSAPTSEACAVAPVIVLGALDAPITAQWLLGSKTQMAGSLTRSVPD